MNVTFSTWGHYQVRQCEFSPPSETHAVSATPHIKAAPYTISERRMRRFCPKCRPPKLQKETSNVLQNSQPLPAHPIPVARRHVSRIAGHHKRRDACDTRTTPQLRRYKTNKFHCQPSFLRDARQMRPERERRLYFYRVETGHPTTRKAARATATGPTANSPVREQERSVASEFQF
jgi:hypothetical protein